MWGQSEQAGLGVRRKFLRMAAGCSLGLVGVAASVVTLAADARAQAEASCSAAYHAALGDLHAKRGDDLGRAAQVLRAADPALPGRWIYSQALFPGAKKNRPVAVERPCAERVKVAGRLRCVRYEDAAAPEPPSELTVAPGPSTEELRVLKALNDLVEARGGVPEVGGNGRFSWLAQRAASDLRLYISQPAHPALCSGGKDFAEFYGNTLKPLQKRIDDVGELSKKARALAVARVNDANTAETAAMSEPTKDAPAKPIVTIAIAADAPLPALVADAIRSVVPAAAVTEVAGETTALAALRRAKGALVAAQVEAQGGDDQKARDRVLAAGRAVRMLEAAAYGEIYVERYKRFSTDVLGTPQAIKAVHTQSCTCGL